jgi:hypothetical protein
MSFPGESAAPHGSTGGTPPGGGTLPPMEARVARLEASVEHIERDIVDIKTDVRSTRETIDRLRDRIEADFRITWAGIIALALGNAGLMAKGFGWL